MMYKKSIDVAVPVISPALGAIIGAALARKGKGWRGAGYGALTGLGAGIGGGLGAGVGLGVGAGLGAGVGGVGGAIAGAASDVGALAGGGVGALGGAGLGLLPGAMIGGGAGAVGGGLLTHKALKKHTAAKDYPWRKSNVEDDNDKNAAEEISMKQPDDKTTAQVPASDKAIKNVDAERDAKTEKAEKPPFDVTTKMDAQEQTVDKDVKAAYIRGVLAACAQRGVDPAAVPGFSKLALGEGNPTPVDPRSNIPGAIVGPGGGLGYVTNSLHGLSSDQLAATNKPMPLTGSPEGMTLRAAKAPGYGPNAGAYPKEVPGGSHAVGGKESPVWQADKARIETRVAGGDPNASGPSWLQRNGKYLLGAGAAGLGAYGLYKLYKWLRSKKEEKEASVKAAYVAGMIKACEERGIDPESIKIAHMIL